jgi:hypothetical protein
MKFSFTLFALLVLGIVLGGCSSDSGEAGSKKLPDAGSGAAGTVIQRDDEGTK